MKKDSLGIYQKTKRNIFLNNRFEQFMSDDVRLVETSIYTHYKKYNPVIFDTKHYEYDNFAIILVKMQSTIAIHNLI